MNQLEQGCIDIWIDEIVPCLKDVETGEIKETVVFKIESRTYLKKFQEKNGWHINWNEIPMRYICIGLVQHHRTISMISANRNMPESADTYLRLLPENQSSGDMKVLYMDLRPMKRF